MNEVQLKSHSSEERRRLWEIVAMVLITIALVGMSRLEAQLFELGKSLSSNKEIFTSVVYFGLINLYVVLILVLSFLTFRNVAKLLLERKRGIFGSRLRTKLVVTLAFFAIAPTILMFYISTNYITTSFDTWLSEKVKDTMQQTRAAGAQVYKQDQRRLESLALIALQRVKFKTHDKRFPGDMPQMDPSGLDDFENAYRLDGVSVYDFNAQMVWSSFGDKKRGLSEKSRSFLLATIARFAAEPGLGPIGIVEAVDKIDVVKGIAPIYYSPENQLVGVVVAEEHFETQILKSIERILDEFASLRPGAQLIRLSYMILLVLMVLVIAFSTTWLGFYVARGIVEPIQSLADATRQVANGNYDVRIDVKTDDETGTLVKAFNKMTSDLKAHSLQTVRFTNQLQMTNDELNHRSQYMEVVLRNITAGVISVDADGKVTSFNAAAERLLGMNAEELIGNNIDEMLSHQVVNALWTPVRKKIDEVDTFNGEINLHDLGKDLTLIAAGIRIHSESGDDLGIVLVFDDATEQARAQRVAAWREVARRIAHEIKNPITPIKLNAQRLQRRYRNQFDEENQAVFDTCLETILSQVDALRDLVNEFSRFSTLPSVNPNLQNINVILQDVTNFYRMSYSNIDFDLSGMDADLPDTMIDKEQMNRVIMNVVSNAVSGVSHLEQGARIAVRSSVVRTLNAVRVEIIDNGMGIPQADKDKVFEPYFSTRKEGTGLGLSIVKQIVTDHGGYIRLTDSDPTGTTVVIELPLGEKTAPPPLT